MKKTLLIVVGIRIEFPDGIADVYASKNSPLDELAARLRREACFGRDCEPGQAVMPDATAWAVAAYWESFHHN